VTADLKKQTLSADLTARIDESNVTAKVDMTNFRGAIYPLRHRLRQTSTWTATCHPRRKGRRASNRHRPGSRATDQFFADQETQPGRSLRIDHWSRRTWKAQNVQWTSRQGRQAGGEFAIGRPLSGGTNGRPRSTPTTPARDQTKPFRRIDRPVAARCVEPGTCSMGAATSRSTSPPPAIL